jgi:hypothetical protein
MTWDGFFTAEVGAAAALTGLIFVGISINLKRILALPMIANRALQSLLILIAALGILSILLVPDQSDLLAGVEVMGVTFAMLAVLNGIELRSWKSIEPKWRRILAQHTLEIQIPSIFFLVGGALLAGGLPAALNWFVPATLLSFLIGFIEAWVITVEILR